MTKPLPTGCMKKEHMSTWRKFNRLLEAVDLDDPFVHLFVVDIHFDCKSASVKQILYNKIFPPTIEKHKIIDPSKRSVYQLLERYSDTNNGIRFSYRPTHKADATLFAKNF